MPLPKFISFFVLAFFIVGTVCSQNELKGKAIAFNKTTEDSTVVLSSDSGGYYLSLVNRNSKPFYANRIPDSIIVSSGNPIENINIHFLDGQYGFIFGNECGYAFYPFLLKTEDGGRNWKRMFFDKETIGPPLLSDNFFMFDKERGIIITNWNDESKFTYHLTEDGGDHWKKKVFQINSKDFRALNASRIQSVVFNENGEITVILWDFDLQKNRDNKVMMLKSYDFGDNFEIIK